jgi:hypothetical protein
VLGCVSYLPALPGVEDDKRPPTLELAVQQAVLRDRNSGAVLNPAWRSRSVLVFIEDDLALARPIATQPEGQEQPQDERG